MPTWVQINICIHIDIITSQIFKMEYISLNVVLNTFKIFEIQNKIIEFVFVFLVFPDRLYNCVLLLSNACKLSEKYVVYSFRKATQAHGIHVFLKIVFTSEYFLIWYRNTRSLRRSWYLRRHKRMLCVLSVSACLFPPEPYCFL